MEGPKAKDEPDKKKDNYVVVEEVPLATLLRMFAKESGLNYFESGETLTDIGDDTVSLNMQSRDPKNLLECLLKIKGLEVYNQGEICSIRRYTNKVDCYIHKLKDNFFESFQSDGTKGATGGGMGGWGAGPARRAGAWAGEDPAVEGMAAAGATAEEVRPAPRSPRRTTASRPTTNGWNPCENWSRKARIYSTSSNPVLKMGVDWSGTLKGGMTFTLNNPTATGSTTGNGTTTGTMTASTTGEPGMSLAQIGKTMASPMSGIIATPTLQAVLNMFASDSSAEAVAEPSALTANNREVAFGATTKIPYIGGSGTTGVGAGAGGTGVPNSFDETEFVEVGGTNVLGEPGLRYWYSIT